MSEYFDRLDTVPFEGPQSDNPLAFRHYNASEMVLGKTMAEQLRMSACYWHSFGWQGSDTFGRATWAHPWQHGMDKKANARLKADIAFEFFRKLQVPFYCFHDTDIAPEGDSLQALVSNLERMVDYIGPLQETHGVKLLWGTANCFSHPRYAAGAATNPDPEVFACAAAQVCKAMDATHKLGGANYVLWGGREGYETLLNTDLKREREQLARFLTMVVDYKHRIGFSGPLLIEPKPHEPTKHQYDYDCSTVFGFLQQYHLEHEFRVNIEANHATLAGHSFSHEVAMALALGCLGSIDANRGDPQLGWDTDQFPNSVEEFALVIYQILKAGGIGEGGFNFDARLRRASVDPYDLFYAHIGAMDTLALALKVAANMRQDDSLEKACKRRYQSWEGPLGRAILAGEYGLDQLAQEALAKGLNPTPRSGQQELLENRVNRYIYS